MSDYLSNLTARSLNQTEVIQPRLASMFERLQSNTGLDRIPNLSLEQPSVNAEAVSENQIYIDIGSEDSLGLKLQEGVGNRGRFQESEIEMETQKFLSVRGEEVTMKPNWKMPEEEANNQRFSVREETQEETTFSVADKSLRESVPITHQKISIPNTHTDLQPYASHRLGVSPDHSLKVSPDHSETPMLRLPSLNATLYEYTSGKQEGVDLATPEVIQQINAIPRSKFTDTGQAIAEIAQLKEVSSLEHSEQFKPGEVSSSVLLPKPSTSNINNLDSLIPLSKQPAIAVHPHVRASTTTNTTFTEQPSPPPTPTINVTIGRIEVRATPPTSPPTKQRPKPPVMGLEEYLHQRAKGDHR